MSSEAKVLQMFGDSEENESFNIVVKFPIEERTSAQRRLTRLPLPGEPIFIKARPWGVRLFSRPWRPHHNVKVWTATGPIDFFDIDADDERVKFSVYGQGRITVRTARHA